VAKDNTVTIGSRLWQIDKTRFRNTLSGSTVTIHKRLDESVSIRYGPHLVGRFDRIGVKLISESNEKRRGKGGSMEAGENQKQVFTHSNRSNEIAITCQILPARHIVPCFTGWRSYQNRQSCS
jgi:hypothetical protein